MVVVYEFRFRRNHEIYPEKSLLQPLPKSGSKKGKLTVRHHGGGHKRQYRVIDFKRNKDGITAKLIQSNMIQTVQLTLLY